MTTSVQITRLQWQQKAAALLQRYVALLAEHGVTVGPDLHLREDPATPYHYCDVNTGQISLNLPGTESLGDLIRLAEVGQAFGLQSLAEIIDLWEALLHYTLCHELGHYLRHHYGAITPDRWVEEEAATILGIALACASPEVAEWLPFLRQMAERVRPDLPVVPSATLARLEAAHPALRQLTTAGLAPEFALRQLGLAAEAEAYLRERDAVMRAFHERYTTDAEAYARQQAAWQVHWFLRPDRPGLQEALRTYVLGVPWPPRAMDDGIRERRERDAL